MSDGLQHQDDFLAPRLGHQLDRLVDDGLEPPFNGVEFMFVPRQYSARLRCRQVFRWFSRISHKTTRRAPTAIGITIFLLLIISAVGGTGLGLIAFRCSLLACLYSSELISRPDRSILGCTINGMRQLTNYRLSPRIQPMTG